MAKTLDLRKSVYELVKEYPEIADIMTDLGFGEIRKKPVLNSVGKLMTIPKGAKFKKVDLSVIVDKFKSAGFTVVGLPEEKKQDDNDSSNHNVNDKQQRLELLKSYLTRLNNGEPLETVRAEFVRNFSSVDASEIMEAEQTLLKEGAPLKDLNAFERFLQYYGEITFMAMLGVWQKCRFVIICYQATNLSPMPRGGVFPYLSPVVSLFVATVSGVKEKWGKYGDKKV